jgi:hypothetical protein
MGREDLPYPAAMRLGLIALLASLALVAAGFTPDSTGRAHFDPGNLMVAGSNVREQSPSGTVLRAFDTGGKARAVAIGQGNLYIAGATPTLLVFEADGKPRGTLASFPDGFDVTAMDADESHIYVATSDGRFLHEIYRFTHAGVTGFPFLVESPVTSLAIASDGCSLFYSTLKRGIRRLDACDEHASSVLISTLAANDIALLPDGSMLVAPRKENALLRLRNDGKIVRRYARAPSRSWSALSVDPDGSTFWAADSTGRLVQFSTSGQALKTLGSLGTVRDLLVVGAPHGPASTWRAREDSSLALDGVSALTGEALVQQLQGRPTPPEACSTKTESTLHFAVSNGRAAGPYPGSFSASEVTRLGPQTIDRPSGPLGVPVGRLLDLDGQFSVSSGGRTVLGSLALPRKKSATNSGACLAFENMTFPRAVIFGPGYAVSGYYRNVHARAFLYSATITSDGRKYLDSGDTALFTDEYHLIDSTGRFVGSANRYQQTFRSRFVSVTEGFSSKGAGTEHSVQVRGNRKTLTLRVEWKRKSDAFALQGIRFHKRSSWRPQSDQKLKPGKLKPGGVLVRTTRKGRTLKVVVAKLKPGELRFKVVPTRLRGATTAKTILENPAGGS